MKGGLGYGEARLRAVLEPRFEILALRQMCEQPTGSGGFGLPVFWVLLAAPR